MCTVKMDIFIVTTAQSPSLQTCIIVLHSELLFVSSKYDLFYGYTYDALGQPTVLNPDYILITDNCTYNVPSIDVLRPVPRLERHKHSLSSFCILLLQPLFIVAMIIPVRCFTCGKVIGNKYDSYLELLASENSAR